jgi:hypothetical protein
MSGISGSKRAITEELVKQVGLFEANVLVINPTLKEYEEVLGFTPREGQEEFDYTGVSRDGNTYVRIDIWLQKVEEDRKFKVVFFLEDKVRQNKDETKTQFINNIGNCSWAADEDTLPSWFVARDYREAKNGEEDFYNFMRIWLGGLNYRDPETELSLNWKNLMKGNVSSIREQIGGEFSTSVISLATIVTKIKEDNETGEETTVEYQSIYNRQFLPAYCMKHFRIKNYNDDMVIANIQARSIRDLKLHEKFVQNVTGEYGCKDFYKLSEIEDYNPAENSVSTDDALIEESEESDSSDMY